MTLATYGGPILTLSLLLGAAAAGAEPAVVAERQTLTIPTYPLGPADKNPIFYAGRKYQGAKGPVYPYAMLDKLGDACKDQAYQSVRLENKYLQLTILPELGGRIFSGLDKTNQYDFFYRQHVIKPALVGMAGAWISGGVEWNIPHHHRVSTFMPVDCRVVENADGSKTVWVGETEWRHRMKWAVGLTLFPDRSYLEITTKLFNRTPLAHSMLCFANAAVHANANYQVLFPPGTQYGTQHAKREFVAWPVGQGVYHKLDRSGVDLSWWKNQPSPVSIFAWNYQDDFVGGYDHGREAGVVHVADHHLAPGKKFFTWGSGDEGRMWDKVLTETDGPYIELMAGAYSDNQPDYSWVQPFETRVVREYWYPLRSLGGLKNANREAAVNLEIEKGRSARIAVNVTSQRPAARVLLQAAGKTLFERQAAIGPAKPFAAQVALPPEVKPEDLRLAVHEGERELISYQAAKPRKEPPPRPVVPPPKPADVRTNEELYLIGLRLEQFHNPAIEPYPYYEEALKRDPGDCRANVALGILYCKRGLFAEAAERFRKALERPTRHFTSPKDAEAYYYLGVALHGQGRHAAADEALHRASWAHAWSAASYGLLAESACRKGDYAAALEFLDRSLETNSLNTRALALKAFVLRKLGRTNEALAAVKAVQKVDPLDFWSINESLVAQTALTPSPLPRRGEGLQEQSHLEVAADYAACGAWSDARDVINRSVGAAADKSRISPMAYYDLAYYCERLGDAAGAKKARELAARAPSDYCFPFRLESIDVLRRAIAANPRDARAQYYLGNLLYDIQPRPAIAAWEAARKIESKFAIVHRNLGLAYARVEGNPQKALESFTAAIACDAGDSRWFCEWDQIAESAKLAREKRLAMLDKHAAVVGQRDDTLLRHVSLCLLLGQYDRALEMLASHHFRRWEGENGPHTLYVDGLLLRGGRFMAAGEHRRALEDFRAAAEYPENFETGRPWAGGPRDPKIFYLTGEALAALGQAKEAQAAYQRAAKVDSSWPEAWYYRGLAYRRLGQTREADAQFAKLVASGTEILRDGWPADFFGIFGVEPPEAAWKGDAHFRIGLGYLGQGRAEEARRHFDEAIGLGMDHLGVQTHRAALKY